MNYIYEAYAPSGETVKGTIEADSEQRAEELLWQSDLTIIRLKKQRTGFSLSEQLPSLFGVKRGDTILFSRQLATLLGSGITILPALQMLFSQTKKEAFKKVLQEMAQDIQTGSLLSQACGRHPNVFPPIYVRLLTVGEETGNLERTLEQLATYMEKETAVVSKIQRALAYPAFIILLAMGVVVIMLNFVLPSLTGLYKEFGAELPTITKIFVSIATFIQAFSRYILAAFGTVVVLGLWYTRTKEGKKKLDAVLVRVPVISGIVIHGSISRMARTLSVLLRSGVGMIEIMNLAVDTMDNAVIKEALQGVRSDIHSGEALSQALSKRLIFPPLVGQMVRVGEETGTLEENLESLGKFYEEEADRAISTMLSLIEPSLVLVVGLVVGFLAVSIVLPIYSIMQQIK